MQYPKNVGIKCAASLKPAEVIVRVKDAKEPWRVGVRWTLTWE